MKELLSDKTLNLNDLPVPVKNQLNYLAKNPKKLLKKYKDSIKNVNDLSDKFNQKQNELFNFLPKFSNDDNEFFTVISTNFLNAIKKNSELLEATKKGNE